MLRLAVAFIGACVFPACGFAQQATTGQHAQPGFDCSRATSAAARLICADPELARISRQLIDIFVPAVNTYPAAEQMKFVADQNRRTKQRDAACGLTGKELAPVSELLPSKPCLMDDMKRQIAVLQARVASTPAQPPTPLPAWIRALMHQMQRCWSAAARGNAAAPRRPVEVNVRLKRDGTLAARPKAENVPADPEEQAAADRIVQGIIQCQPYKMLPADKYDQWKELFLAFAPN